MSKPALRPAETGDVAGVRALLLSAELPLDGLDDQFGAAFVVATDQNEIVGAMGIERYGPYGLLRSAVTRPDWRGRGLGQALTHERIGWAQGQKMKALYLLTTTAADFFSRFGFERVERPLVPDEIRRSREFASACPESAVVMVRTL